MKLKWLVMAAAVTLAGCSEEAKEDMSEAAEHAKAAAKSVGEAVSKSGEEISEKIEEMNREAAKAEEKAEVKTASGTVELGEDGLPKPAEYSFDEVKQKLSEAKDTVMEKVESISSESDK
ncbi:MAG: hypothetical protein ABW072_18740 [Sedimenticola sp.]